jgi:hypothetical protein
MASLDTIPQEIQDQVFAMLSLQDKAAVSKMNRRMHAAVIPSMYRTIELAWAFPRTPVLNRSPDCAALLRTLKDKADYAGRVTTLRLKNAPLPTRTVMDLLNYTPKLSTFEYHAYLPSSCTPLDLDDLQMGLSHVNTTLENLCIRYNVYADEALDVESLSTVLSGSLGTLRSFSKLTHVNISPLILFGRTAPNTAQPLAQLLPPGLQRLTLNDDLWGWDSFYKWSARDLLDVLGAFLGTKENDNSGAWRTATPSLREVSITIQGHGRVWVCTWESEERAELRAFGELESPRCYVMADEDEDEDYSEEEP